MTIKERTMQLNQQELEALAGRIEENLDSPEETAFTSMINVPYLKWKS
jgi:hypothetical protein